MASKPTWAIETSYDKEVRVKMEGKIEKNKRKSLNCKMIEDKRKLITLLK